MRTLKTAVAGAFAIVCVACASPAQAEADANFFISKIDSGDAVSRLVLSSYGYGFTVANTRIMLDKGKPLFCQPGFLTLTDEQTATILRDYIKRRPQAGTHPAAIALLYAFQETFPC